MNEFSWDRASIRDTIAHFDDSLKIFGERATPHAPNVGEALLCCCCCPLNPCSALFLNWLWHGDMSSYVWFLLFPLEAPHRSMHGPKIARE